MESRPLANALVRQAECPSQMGTRAVKMQVLGSEGALRAVAARELLEPRRKTAVAVNDPRHGKDIERLRHSAQGCDDLTMNVEMESPSSS